MICSREGRERTMFSFVRERRRLSLIQTPSSLSFLLNDHLSTSAT
jgi:hypothetical protein